MTTLDILNQLGPHGRPATDIAASLGLSPRRVREVLAALEDEGRCRRVPGPLRDDGRAFVVYWAAPSLPAAGPPGP